MAAAVQTHPAPAVPPAPPVMSLKCGNGLTRWGEAVILPGEPTTQTLSVASIR